ncbi:MAG: hypothetical protein WA160_07640 [Pseudobdellovibrio sp.]
MSSLTAGFLLIVPLFFLFSIKVEKNKVITISKPIVITQARKTPAFYLYQQANKLDQDQTSEQIQNVASTFLSTDKTIAVAPVVELVEMKFDQRDIGSEKDYGFQIAKFKPIQNEEKQNVDATQTIPYKDTLSENKPAVVVNASPLKKWATVRGKFEVKDGVGVVDHIVEIKRVEEGQVREIGQIDLKAGSYSIDIESPQGELVAQITDRNGLLIGRDQQKVVNLQSRGSYFEGPFIRVGFSQQMAANPELPGKGDERQTVAENRSGRTPANNSMARAKEDEFASGITASLFSDQHQLEKAKDQFGNISRTSSTISLIADKKLNYMNMITIRQTGDLLETPLFTKKWIDGVITYVADQMKIEFKSKTAPIIIGRVFSDKKPLAGARVQIESQPGLNPIYLDQFMIPSMKQDSTSENGYFMFVGLEQDDYSVVAFQNNKITGHQMFTTVDSRISYQNILSSSVPHVVLVRSFDAFTGQPADADIISSDLEEIIETKAGIASFRTNNELGLSTYLVRPKQGYMPINYVQDSRLDHVHIPLVSEEQLTNIQQQLQIESVPNTGNIIGFVPGADYEMYLISEEYNISQIAYFNQNGQISKGPMPGGGFILFNVPIGAREVVVQEKKTERIFSQVYFIKTGQTSVSHFAE